MEKAKFYLFYFYVPESHKEEVKEAVFKAHAGEYKNYEACCFEVSGVGQFRPKKSARPYVGKLEELEKVVEYKIEMLVASSSVLAVKKALIDSHPYEEVAFGFIELIGIDHDYIGG